MQITYNPDLIVQHDNDQTVYFTLTDDNDNAYEWHGDIPKDVDIQKYLEANIKKFLLLIRKREYLDARFEVKEDETELEAMELWITNGHTNPEIISDNEEKTILEKEEVIEKVPFVSTHPKPDPRDVEIADLKKRIEVLEMK